MPYIKCTYCKKETYKRPFVIKKNKNLFCSKECHSDFIKSHYPEADRKCFFCGNSFRVNPAYIKRRPNANNYCSYDCYFSSLRTPRVSEKSDSAGYKRMRGLSGHNTREHRFIMEQILGRKLDRTEHVHHINFDKSDNRPENLVILSESEHHRLHRQKQLEDSGYYDKNLSPA